MQTITLRCDDSVAGHIYALLSNTRGVEIERHKKVEAKKQNDNAFLEFAGLWKDRDVTPSSIREKAWKR
jgi:hypothetical protein